MDLMRVAIDARSNPRRARHTHSGHELLVVAAGSGTQLVAAGEEPCRSGDIFVFPAGFPHLSHCAPGQEFTCLVLSHEPGDFADTSPGDGGAHLLALLAEGAGPSCRLPVRPVVAAQVRALLERAVGEWRSPERGGRCAARALAMQALVALARDPRLAVAAPDPNQAADRHVDDAVRWIARYWMQPVRIADLVALGPLGRSQFLARFRARTGTTPAAALLAARLREARRLLREDPGRNLLDLALSCGFASQSHFNHRFRAGCGLSPRAWLAGGAGEAPPSPGPSAPLDAPGPR